MDPQHLYEWFKDVNFNDHISDRNCSVDYLQHFIDYVNYVHQNSNLIQTNYNYSTTISRICVKLTNPLNATLPINPEIRDLLYELNNFLRVLQKRFAGNDVQLPSFNYPINSNSSINIDSIVDMLFASGGIQFIDDDDD